MQRVFVALALLFCGCSHSGEIMTLRFVDEDGKPVAGVETRINRGDSVLKSNRNGNCTLDLSAAQTKKSFHLYIWHPDYVYLRCGFGAY